MKKIDSLRIPFYEFRCKENLIEEIIASLTEIKFLEDASNFNSGDFFHRELFDWFEQCLCEVRDELYSNEIDLKITSCWINKSKKFQNTHLHSHTNSIVSGVLYFSDETSGKTIFKFANPWFHTQNNNVLQLTKNIVNGFPNPLTYEVTPEKGKLILFPSSILHQVSTFTGNKERYSLAFNTFLSGKINVNDVTSKLSISLSGV